MNSFVTGGSAVSTPVELCFMICEGSRIVTECLVWAGSLWFGCEGSGICPFDAEGVSSDVDFVIFCRVLLHV